MWQLPAAPRLRCLVPASCCRSCCSQGRGTEQGEGAMQKGGKGRERRNRKSLCGEIGVCSYPCNPGSVQAFTPQSHFSLRIVSLWSQKCFRAPRAWLWSCRCPWLFFQAPGKVAGPGCALGPSAKDVPHLLRGSPVTPSSVPSQAGTGVSKVWDLQNHQEFAVEIQNLNGTDSPCLPPSRIHSGM